MCVILVISLDVTIKDVRVEEDVSEVEGREEMRENPLRVRVREEMVT